MSTVDLTGLPRYVQPHPELEGEFVYLPRHFRVRKIRREIWEGTVLLYSLAGYMRVTRRAETKLEATKLLNAAIRESKLDPKGYYWPKPGNTNLYFIQGIGGGAVKIGLSQNIQTRLRAIQYYSPVTLQVIYSVAGVSYEAETFMHARLADHRLHGEWFESRYAKFAIRTILENPECLFVAKSTSKVT